MIGAITLQEFVVARQAEFAGATGDLSRLLTDIGTAAKMVNRHINRAGLSGILGAHEPDGHSTTNIQGCLLCTSPSPRDMRRSRMPSSA